MVCAGYYGGGKDSCQVNHIYQGLFFIIQKARSIMMVEYDNTILIFTLIGG